MEDLDKGAFLLLPFALMHLLELCLDGYSSRCGAFTNSFVDYSGLDAIGRVLRKAKKEGMRTFGHSYKKSESDIAGLSDHV